MDKKRSLMRELQQRLNLGNLDAEYVNNVLDVVYLEGKQDGIKESLQALSELEGGKE